jgi:hypothetical protein
MGAENVNQLQNNKINFQPIDFGLLTLPLPKMLNEFFVTPKLIIDINLPGLPSSQHFPQVAIAQ